MARRKSMIGGVLLAALSLGAAWAAKPKPQRKWQQAGKSVKALCRRSKDKNACCAKACHKKGAKKAADLGACKEACFFG